MDAETFALIVGGGPVGLSAAIELNWRGVPTILVTDKLAAEIKSRPPVLLIHGDQDELIPAQALFQASSGLAALGVPVEWHLSAGIGHGIDQEGLRHGGEFLARRAPKAPTG